MNYLILLLLFYSGFASELRLLKSLWGVIDFDYPERWSKLFKRIHDEGYFGIECPNWVVPKDHRELFKSTLKESGLIYVSQVHLTNYPCYSYDIDEHITDLQRAVEDAIDLGAIQVNSHSGSDWWVEEEVKEFLEKAEKIDFSIPVTHETHRQRIFFTPSVSSRIFNITSHLDYSLTADLSHWIVSAGRLMDWDTDESRWGTLMKEVVRRTRHLHARVGSTECSQVGHPSAPEVQDLVGKFSGWWSKIFREAIRDDDDMFVTVEFGPAPYQPVLPFTNVPTSDLWEVNSAIGKVVEKLWKEALQAGKHEL